MDQIRVLYKKIDLRIFTVKIESYKDIFLYFCEIENINKYLTLVYMTLVNGYNVTPLLPYNL